MLYIIATVRSFMKKKTNILDAYVCLSDELLDSLKACIIKLGRDSEEGLLVREETWPSVYKLMQLREESNKVKKTK